MLTALYIFFFYRSQNSLSRWVLLSLFYRKLMFRDVKGLDRVYSVAERQSGEVKAGLWVVLFLHGMLLKPLKKKNNPKAHTRVYTARDLSFRIITLGAQVCFPTLCIVVFGTLLQS